MERSVLKHFGKTAERLIGFSIMMVCLSWCLAFVASADEADVLIDKALKGSGIASQIEHLGPAILAAIPEDAFPDRKTKSDAGALIKEHTSGDILNAVVRSAVREQVDAETLGQVVNFYDSKLGKKVGRAQSSAVESSAVKRVREGRPILQSLGESRAATLKRIIAAQGVLVSTDQLLTATLRGLVEGSLTNEKQPSPRSDDMKRKIRLVEKEIRADRNRMEQTALISFAHTFQALGDKELEELAQDEESPGASRFRSAVQTGLERAVFRVGQSLGEFTVRPNDQSPRKVPRTLEEKSHQIRTGEDAESKPPAALPESSDTPR
jgi:hypothetical protein